MAKSKLKINKKPKDTKVANVKGAVKVIKTIEGTGRNKQMVIKWLDKKGKVLQESYGDIGV